MNDDLPVTMDSLVCVGGVAHGERADIPSDQNYVNCSPPRSIRKPGDVMDLSREHAYRYDSYKREHCRFGRHRFQVLICAGTPLHEAEFLIRELFKERKLP